ncbi:hypothetical protein [Symbiopectobacterium sp. RP]|uniref:hypothetical protein n=1 Tax=Symbiopectobacterium sp. RP TaxID=3248553 RepID=UPI003D2BCAA9
MAVIIFKSFSYIEHMRTLSSQGICWLIRGKEGHRAEWGGDTRKIGEIADDLPFIANGQVGWKGKKANMEIGETSVIITRTAKAKRKDKNTGRRVKVQPSVALTLRLVVVRLIAKRLKNDYSQCPDMWQKNTANCYQNNVAWLY